MAAKTPVDAGTAGYVDQVRGLATGVRASAEALLSVGTIVNDRTKYRTLIRYFADIDDGDTWTSGLAGVKACFWQGDAEGGDACNAVLTTAASGTITFETAATSDVNGWLLLFIESDDPAMGLAQR